MLRDLQPSQQRDLERQPFTTNRWGMRDRTTRRRSRAGTLRIALLGPSHVMGNGVADGETFESAGRGAAQPRVRGRPRTSAFEILNFGVDGYSLPQQLAMLEDRVLRLLTPTS